MNNHSSGPWKIRGDILYAGEVPLYRLQTVVGMRRELTVLEDDANRRLIEAGPEMLSLLQRLTHPMASDSDVDDARALLAKLEGSP